VTHLSTSSDDSEANIALWNVRPPSERHVLDNGFGHLSIPFPSHDERSLAYAESGSVVAISPDTFSSFNEAL
jgi:hypothetical protein